MVKDTGTSTVTPPRASVSPSKPAKSTSATSSTRVSKFCSMVLTMVGIPPTSRAELILASPWPGMSTQVSRMMDITYISPPSSGMCSSMMESAREPVTVGSWPSGRLSEPSSSTVVPASSEEPLAGRLDSSGNADSRFCAPLSKLRARFHTKNPATTPITRTMPRSTRRMFRPVCFLRGVGWSSSNSTGFVDTWLSEAGGT